MESQRDGEDMRKERSPEQSRRLDKLTDSDWDLELGIGTGNWNGNWKEWILRSTKEHTPGALTVSSTQI